MALAFDILTQLVRHQYATREAYSPRMDIRTDKGN